MGDRFDHTFRNGVLTVQADFAEKISGLTIEDRAHDIIYRLRYLDSRSLHGWQTCSGTMKAGAKRETAKRITVQPSCKRKLSEKPKAKRKHRRSFALLEGTWVTEDGLQKYEFVENEDKKRYELLYYVVEQRDTRMVQLEHFVESAFGRRALTLVAMQIAFTTKLQKRPKS